MRYSISIVVALASFAGCVNESANTRQTSPDTAIEIDTATSDTTAYVSPNVPIVTHVS